MSATDTEAALKQGVAASAWTMQPSSDCLTTALNHAKKYQLTEYHF